MEDSNHTTDENKLAIASRFAALVADLQASGYGKSEILLGLNSFMLAWLPPTEAERAEKQRQNNLETQRRRRETLDKKAAAKAALKKVLE